MGVCNKSSLQGKIDLEAEMIQAGITIPEEMRITVPETMPQPRGKPRIRGSKKQKRVCLSGGM